MKAIIANRLALVGAIITAIVLAGVIVGPWLSPYSPTDSDFMALLDPPSGAHPFGTDSFGRDVLTRILYGARVSLIVGLSVAAFSSLLGLALGLACGYFRKVDGLVMRIMDGLMAIPSILLGDTFALSYPSRRYRSALIGIIVHSSQSVMVLTLVLFLVLR